MRIEEIMEDALPEMEKFKKSVPTGYMPYQAPLPFHTIPISEASREVNSISGDSPRKAIGHSPYDSITSADSDQYRASEISGVQARSLVATPPPVEHTASGSVLLQKIGTITARLTISMEALLQSLHIVPDWLPKACLAGRCNALAIKKHEVENSPTEEGKKGQKKEKVQSSQIIYCVSIVCQVVHTLFSTLLQYLYQGYVLARDEGIPLLGRVTKSCIEMCEEASKQVRNVCTSSSDGKVDHLAAWCVNKCKTMVSWMKAWIFG